MSLDATTVHGRWRSTRTRRLYIDSAMSELTAAQQAEEGRCRVQRALICFSAALATS